MSSTRLSAFEFPVVPARRFLPAVLAALCLTLALGRADAQAFPAGGTVAVVTSEGFFLVPPGVGGLPNIDPLALRRATPGDFGLTGSLSAPGIAWIRNSSTFYVSSRTQGASVGGLWAVTVLDGLGTLSIVQVAAGDYSDVEYSFARNQLFVYEPGQGTILVTDPFVPSLAIWNSSLPIDAGLRIAMQDTAVDPVLLVTGVSTLYEVPDDGAPAVLWHNGDAAFWQRIETHPHNLNLYVLSTSQSLFGLPVLNLLTDTLIGAVNMNLGPGFCQAVSQPRDVTPDLGGLGLVVVAGSVNNSCLGTSASGNNHVVWFPSVLGGTPPLLLTPAPVSGIGGNQASCALVLPSIADVGHAGVSDVGSGGVSPQLALTRLDVSLTAAAANAPALLSIALPPAAGPVDVGPNVWVSPDLTYLLNTNAAGSILLPFPAPTPATYGSRAVLQWTVEDPVVAGLLLHSNRGALVVGL